MLLVGEKCNMGKFTKIQCIKIGTNLSITCSKYPNIFRNLMNQSFSAVMTKGAPLPMAIPI